MNRLHAYPLNPLNPLRIRRSLVATAVACCFAPGLAIANPTGPAVISGQASFAAQGKQLTVTNSPGSIINWQGFSIGTGETTRFIQQSAASAVLNRVVGPNPSAILGSLQSNGRVVLVNPNGILFGASAAIDVAGLIASTLNITNADFLSGRMRFVDTPGAGPISNAGEIRTPDGGKVVLISPQGVENNGIIHSPKGEVILAAGKSVELADSNNPEIRVEISAPDARAINLGRIVAESGKVGIYGGIVTNRGIVSADSAVVGENGKIVFRSSKETTLEAGSITTASGKSGGTIELSADAGTTLVAGSVQATGSAETGGNVQVLGERVGLIGQGSIDVSGERGGGTVLVGGDLQGKNPNVRNAQMTYVGGDTSIKADAGTEGNGGKVIVWADDTTRSHGTISARGGQRSGDGGFVETSGKQRLDVTKGPDVRAPAGKAGTWLIDPNNIEIVAGAEFDETTNTGAPFFAPLTDSSRIGVDLINAQLDFGSNVVINTTSRGATAGTDAGNIVVSAPLVKASETLPDGPFIGTTSLTLQAHNDIIVTPAGTITSTGDRLNVILTANADNTGGGALTLGGAITTNGGSVTLQGAGLVQINAPINTLNATGIGGGTVTATSTANMVNLASTITSGSNVTAFGHAGVNVSAPVTGNFFSGSTTTGPITIASSISTTSGMNLSGFGINIAAGSVINTGFGGFSATDTAPSSINIAAGASIVSSGATLTSDNMEILGSLNAGAGTVTLRQNTVGRPIFLGANAAGGVALASSELNQISTTGSIFIGNTSSGAITLNGPVGIGSGSHVVLTTGSTLTQNAGASFSANAPVTVSAPTGVAINAPFVGGHVTVTTNDLTVNTGSGGKITSATDIDIRTSTSGRPINLGVAAHAAGSLDLTSNEINNGLSTAGGANTGVVRIGTTSSGALMLQGPLALLSASTLTLNSGASIGQAAGATLTATNLRTSAQGAVNLAESNAVLNLAGNAGFGSTFAFTNGATGLTVGTADGVSGISASGASTANLTAGSLAIAAPVSFRNANLTADSLDVSSAVFASSGVVTLQPRNAATRVDLGGTDAGGVLGLSATDLANVFASKLIVKADQADISAAIAPSTSNFEISPITAGRLLNIVSGPKNPSNLEFIPGDIGNVSVGMLQLGSASTGPVSVNTALTVPATIGNFVLQSADTTNGIITSAAIAATNSLGFITDTFSVGAAVSSSNGGINIATNTGARNINLGADPGTTLGLSSGELGLLSAPLGTLAIQTSGGSIDVTGTVAFAPGSVGGLTLDAGTTATVGISTTFTTPTALSMRAPTVVISSPTTASTGNVSLIGNSINVGSAVTASAGDINVMPRDFRNIDLGGVDGASLGLSNVELNNLSPSGVLRIGDTSGITNSINVSSAISLPASRVLSLNTANGNVTQGAAGTITIPSGSLAVNAFNQITLTQANDVANVALMSQNNAISFTRATGGPLNIATVDGITGVSARFGSSPVTLTADQINIGATTQGSTVTLLPTSGGNIDIGTKGGFSFTQAEFDQIYASAVTVGNALSGNINVSLPVSINTFSDLSLVTGASKTVSVAAGADLTVPGNLNITAGTLTTGAMLTSNFGGLTLIADSIALGAMATSNGGAITVRPLTAGNFVDVGGPDVVSTTSTLGLNGADLANLSYLGGTLTIGGTTAGNMAVTHAGVLPDNVALITGGQATFSSSTFSAAGNLNITANTMSIPGVAGIAAGGNISITPTTGGRAITLGTKPATGLELDATELTKISAAGILSFDTSGILTTTAALPFTLVPDVTLSGGTVNLTGGMLSASGNLTLLGNDIPGAGFSGVTSTAGGRITIAPRTSRSMTIGTAPGGTLGLLPAQLALLSTTGPVQLGNTGTASSLSVTAPLVQPAGSSALVLAASGAISQTAGSTITASALRLQSNFGTMTLAEHNSVGTLAGSTSGNFSFTSAGTLNIGTVDGFTGIIDSTVTLRADALNINEMISAGTVTLAPKSTGAAIDLGSKSGGFGITEAEIDRISASTVNIGTSGTNPTGVITVSAPVDTNFMNLNLVTGAGGTINVNAALGSATTNSLSLNAGLGGTITTVAPLQSRFQITGTGTAITTNAPVTSDFSFVTFAPAATATGSFATINGAITAPNNINITADNITVNAPLNATASFSSVNLAAFSNVATSSVIINQPVDAGSSINITSNAIALNSTLTTSASSVTLQPKAPGVPISVGLEVPGSFSLTTAELGLIATDQLTIGNTTAGPLTVTSAIGPFSYDSLSLRSGGDVTQTPGSTITVRNEDPTDPTIITGSLNVIAGGKILLPEDNNIAVSISGSASGTSNNFEFNNIGPLKLQNVTGVFATGKVILSAPPGSFMFPPDGDSLPRSPFGSLIAALLDAQDTQNDADQAADERKEEAEQREKDDQKKKGTQSCS